MRTLCLNLQKAERPYVAESFLTFSPRVHFRSPGWVFMDIGSTSHLFGGEKGLLNEALSLSKEFFPEAQGAISDTPFGAEVFAQTCPEYISEPGREMDELSPLPLSALHYMEGLVAWNSAHEIESIVDFFHLLGLRQLQEIRQFEVESFRERWGTTGTVLWKRLHGLDKQVISPLMPSEALHDYVHLDFAVSLLPFLLHCLEKSLKLLFSRLQGRNEFTRKVQLHLYCEYSDKCHMIELSPAQPCRQLDLFLKLLENKLSDLDLENPIREFEVDIIPCAEKTQQLDFWQPQIADKEKLDQLVSVFHQASVTTGFFKPQDEILPENSWDLTPEFEPYDGIEDQIEVDGNYFQVKPAYSHQLPLAPRPSRLLKRAQPLSEHQVRRLHFLSSHPIERLEDAWWQDSRGRDYYFALSPKGECLWVYYDKVENQHYIHGYFD